MVGDVTASSVSMPVSRLLGGKAASASFIKRGQKSPDYLLAIIEKDDPQKAHDLKRQMEDVQSMLDDVKDSMSRADEQRKAAARQKIQEIKAKLQALRMLASVDPEAAARQAAQLSRELSRAVKQYAGSGGGIPLGGGSGASTIATATGAGGEAEEEGVKGELAAMAAGAESAPKAAQASQPDSGAGEAMVGSADGESAAAGTEMPAAEKAVGEDGSLNHDLLKKSEEEQRRASASKADSDFVEEVRKIKQALKDVIKLAKLEMEREGKEAQENRDILDAEKALREVSGTLPMVGTHVPMTEGVSVAVDILV